jgi:hypothetical protein
VTASESTVEVNVTLDAHATSAAVGAAPTVDLKLRRPVTVGDIKQVTIDGAACEACWSGESVELPSLGSDPIVVTVFYQ